MTSKPSSHWRGTELRQAGQGQAEPQREGLEHACPSGGGTKVSTSSGRLGTNKATATATRHGHCWRDTALPRESTPTGWPCANWLALPRPRPGLQTPGILEGHTQPRWWGIPARTTSFLQQVN